MLAQHDVASDLRARLERVQAAMAERGLGGLLLYASGQHAMLRMDQVMYLSDVRVLGPHGVLIVPPLIGAWARVGNIYGRVARPIEGGFAIDFEPGKHRQI